MRAFEFQGGELEDKAVTSLIVDLDSVVRLTEKTFSDDRTRWVVTFSSGDHEFVTKSAFDRILLAWKSK